MKIIDELQMIMRIFWLVCFILLTSCQINSIETGSQDSSKRKISPQKTVRAQKNMISTEKFIPTAQDGAPAGPVPKRFKKVKPVNEPLSRYGNPATYQVSGHRYEVMTTATGYRRRGLASWYGTKFHSKRTSSGEDYDMYALTAAHKTLPLPTYVRVKNLNNGRVAIVKVNDRGPFHTGRIIDLSYAAATKLGVFPKGTALVEIEALNTADPGQRHVAHYYLQAGAFESRALAELLRNKLAKLTPSPVFIEKYQQRFLVRVGPFADRPISERLKVLLKNNGVPGAFSLLM
jgi:rare lipoprotein A